MGKSICQKWVNNFHNTFCGGDQIKNISVNREDLDKTLKTARLARYLVLDCWDFIKQLPDCVGSKSVSFLHDVRVGNSNLSRCIRKTTVCISKTKGADQLCSNCTDDQRLCFCLIDSMMPPLSKSEI